MSFHIRRSELLFTCQKDKVAAAARVYLESRPALHAFDNVYTFDFSELFVLWHTKARRYGLPARSRNKSRRLPSSLSELMSMTSLWASRSNVPPYVAGKQSGSTTLWRDDHV